MNLDKKSFRTTFLELSQTSSMTLVINYNQNPFKTMLDIVDYKRIIHQIKPIAHPEYN